MFFTHFLSGWHRRLIAKAGQGQLNFCSLVPVLRKEANLVDVQLILVDEQLLSRCRRKTYRVLHTKITDLWDQLEGKIIKTFDFLRDIGHLYALS